jgi:hypothetical protein
MGQFVVPLPTILSSISINFWLDADCNILPSFENLNYQYAVILYMQAFYIVTPIMFSCSCKEEKANRSI